MEHQEMEQRLRAAGWVNKPKGWWWPPVMKEVVDRKAHRTCGIPLNHAFAYLIRKEQEVARKKSIENHSLEVHCNKCGKDLRKYDINPTEPEEKPHCVGYYGLVETTVDGGFWSESLHDTIRYRFSLCEECLVEFMKTFKVPVHTESYLY